jgi:hypothetical protein
MGQPRQIDDAGGMSAAPPIAARCCTALGGARGRLNRGTQRVR